MQFGIFTKSTHNSKHELIILPIKKNPSKQAKDLLESLPKNIFQQFEMLQDQSFASYELFFQPWHNSKDNESSSSCQWLMMINCITENSKSNDDKSCELDNTQYAQVLQTISQQIAKYKAQTQLLLLDEIDYKNDNLNKVELNRFKSQQASLIIEQHFYNFNECKTKEKRKFPSSKTKVDFYATSKSLQQSFKEGIAIAQAINSGMTLCKDLANLPGNICTPSYLAKKAKDLSKNTSIKSTVLDEKQMSELGMRTLLSVSKGSDEPAKFIAMEYYGAAKSEQPFVIIGKGLTFDAGGISIKPAAAMDEMKYDMCGGASVFGIMKTLSELKPKINVIGLVPSSENLINGKANKPGDIIKSMDGKTIEILNTDAEGRLILADALCYAKQYSPKTIIDIATLTGACIIALGKHMSGLFSNDDALANDLIKAGYTSNDLVWRLPLHPLYNQQLKSNFADLANIGGREAGAVTAAEFLQEFVDKDTPWAHLDIAGTAWISGAKKGATSRPVPLLVQYLLNQIDN